MTPIRLGIVGFGIMGQRLAGFVAAHDQDVLRMSGVWDPSPAAAEPLGRIAPGVPLLADAAAVIESCDCLYIASPPAAHIPLARAAIAAGRAVFMEKPLASDVPAARAFVAWAKGARAAVNFPMASSPAVAQLRAWRGGIGQARSLSIHAAFATWPRGWQQGAASWLSLAAEGGFTREVLSHFLFLTLRELGPLDLVSGRATYPIAGASEAAVAASLTAGGLPVTVSAGVGITEADDHNLWTLEGITGAIRLRDWSFAERRGGDCRFEPAPDAIPNERMRPISMRAQLDKVAAMARGEPQDLATLAEALAVQEIVEALLARR
ncbi:Gfo/Idh/MocA family protein [Humitalea sp. 24SJ18S-53]|uniref:Gfo/Idh/MocA family protein n=1 Tax=Humitalea sp. 24SJ18S-53 TaxID=3422307 RepID=UPI003D66D88D